MLRSALLSKKTLNRDLAGESPQGRLTHSLKCYKCGQYNEGVGSITPCINYTAHMDLKDCPPSAEWCIVSTHIRVYLFIYLEEEEKEGEGTSARIVFRKRDRTPRSLMRFDFCSQIPMGGLRRGLEHEDVLLPAGGLQLGSVVCVQQQPHGPCDHDGGSSGASWLIRRFRRPWDREREQRDPFDAGITALTWSIIVLALLLTGR
ncbi:hypothetical protein E2986_10944 [Frieseomelitta varia]|uniref:Uncharacterized protein n=1 Tax=Frieseomelitta varia TaxID=561572 RepID=A0A833SN22_9HYME|nr:hypothetical protein E2986_10944 [Frieseomelitta varia]